MDYPHTTATRKTMLENAVKNLEFHSYRDPGLMQPSTLLKEAPKVRFHPSLLFSASADHAPPSSPGFHGESPL